MEYSGVVNHLLTELNYTLTNVINFKGVLIKYEVYSHEIIMILPSHKIIKYQIVFFQQ